MVPSKSIAKKGEREQTNQTICNINIPPGFTFKTKQKASMGDNLMKVWTEDLWLKHTQAEFKRLRFQKPVLLSFAAHLADGVKTKLSEGNSDILATSAGCTLKWQPMQVYQSKQFKTILRKCLVK